MLQGRKDQKNIGLSVETRPMNPITLFCFILFFLSVSGYEQPSAYEALQQYDFPAGVLPQGVTGYELNPVTGEFSAHLNGTCYFTLDNSYELKYKSTIKGVITQGRIAKLSGVSVKVVLLWLNIGEVRRSGNRLEFSVGVASASFPTRDFEECPQCGCGLSCGKDSREFKLNRFVSSS